MNLPPTVMWDPSADRWDRRALLLLEAFDRYDKSLCSACAQSAFHALDVANTREFSADAVTCLGCNVRETWQENHSHQKTKGLKVYVINSMGQVSGEDGDDD